MACVNGATEAELLSAYKAVSVVSWRSSVVLIAQLVAVKPAKRGRGQVDKAGVGIKAAIARQSKLLRLSTTTIKNYVRLFNTFFKNGTTCFPILEEIGYFQAALRFQEPLKAIKQIEKLVRANPNFTPTDADVLASKHRAKRVPAASTLAQLNDSQSSLASHIIWAKKELLRIKKLCPDKDFAERMYNPVVEDLDDQLAFMAEQRAEDLCRSAWDRGYHREKQISDATGLDRKTVGAAMLRLSENNEFWQVDEVTHGRRDKRWQKAGEPLGDAYVAPDQMRKTG